MHLDKLTQYAYRIGGFAHCTFLTTNSGQISIVSMSVLPFSFCPLFKYSLKIEFQNLYNHMPLCFYPLTTSFSTMAMVRPVHSLMCVCIVYIYLYLNTEYVLLFGSNLNSVTTNIIFLIFKAYRYRYFERPRNGINCNCKL